MRDEIEIWNEGGEIDLRLLSGVGVILQFQKKSRGKVFYQM